MSILICDPLQHTSIYQRVEEDSDDSDGEGGLGNVNRVIMRPPGHSGKAKRGHLCFDASFETGNLGRVDLINEYEYDLFIRPDTCSPRFRFWFNFTVDNVRQDQRVIFNVVNISKRRNLFGSNMTPLVKSTTRPKWQRIPKYYVFYNKSQIHRGNYILSFVFAFDREDEVFQFALAPPYSYSKLQVYLSALEHKFTDSEVSFKRELLGSSIQKRRLDLITIGTLDKVNNEKKRVVIILARTHPGDSPGSFVCQGLVDLLLSSNPIALILREHVVFKIIPMINPDGVFVGNYRSNIMGFDLNRNWNIASPFGHPTLKTLIEMIYSIDKSKEVHFDFILDIHANTTLTGCFIYGNTYEDVYRYERHTVFPKLLATTCDDYASENTMYNADAQKVGTARRFFCMMLNQKVNCYSFEVSMFGYKLKGSDTLIPYTEESYMRCGRNLLRTFLEYYQVTGIIPIPPPDEITTKKRRPKTHRSRSVTRNSDRNRPKTTRIKALLHFKDLNINYDSETSGEEIYSCRYHISPRKYYDKYNEKETIIREKFMKKIGGEVMLSKRSEYVSPPPAPFVVLPQPSLSIIDFNVITRTDFENALKKNKS